jgi:hypothetical protein
MYQSIAAENAPKDTHPPRAARGPAILHPKERATIVTFKMQMGKRFPVETKIQEIGAALKKSITVPFPANTPPVMHPAETLL